MGRPFGITLLFLFAAGMATPHATAGPNAPRSAPRSASDCTAIDIRATQTPEIRRFLETSRDQGGIGWCYAFAAADLLAVKLGKVVSPVDLALHYNLDYYTEHGTHKKPETKVDRSLEHGGSGGDALEAIAVAKSRGVCPDSLMPSDGIQVQRVGEFLWDSFHEIETLHQAIRKNMSLEEFFKKTQCKLRVTRNLPGLDMQTIYMILWLTRDQHINTSLYNLGEASCKGRRLEIPDSLKPVYLKVADKPSFLPKIDEQLAKGNIVAVSYHKRMIKPWKRGEKDGYHQTTLIGREFRDGKCQYLMRNYWGNDCSSYKPSIKKGCVIRDGTFWIPEEEMTKEIYDLSYLE